MAGSGNDVVGNSIEQFGEHVWTIAGITAIGYILAISGTATLIDAGLAAYIGLLAFPCLLFKATATLDLGTVDPAIVGAVLTAKTAIFGLALLIGRRVLPVPSDAPPEYAKMRGALAALFSTMSDDIGLGYPFLVALFPPKLVDLLFILSAMQALTLNPVAFVLFGAAKRGAQGEASDVRAELIEVARQLRRNRLVVFTILGLAYNLSISRWLSP
jgi:hypothetical protein